MGGADDDGAPRRGGRRDDGRRRLDRAGAAAVCSIEEGRPGVRCPGTELSVSRGKSPAPTRRRRRSRPLARVAVSGRSVSGPLSVPDVPMTGIASGARVRRVLVAGLETMVSSGKTTWSARRRRSPCPCPAVRHAGPRRWVPPDPDTEPVPEACPRSSAAPGSGRRPSRCARTRATRCGERSRVRSRPPVTSLPRTVPSLSLIPRAEVSTTVLPSRSACHRSAPSTTDSVMDVPPMRAVTPHGEAAACAGCAGADPRRGRPRG